MYTRMIEHLSMPFIALVAILVPATVTATVTEHMLDNGMKVIAIENDRAPVIVSQIWYKVGGSYEHDGITGVSHVLEHMMFKGTERYPDGRFSEIIAENGGKENAFTAKDYTAYFQRIASEKLELVLELEADRMRNLIFKEEHFEKELEVVKEERRLRTEDKPSGMMYERFNSVAFANNPYRQPIIGWMEDLETLTVEDARDWYRRWYAPNNATLVVAGDVDPDELFRLAEKYFGSYETVEVPGLKPRRESKQRGEQRVVVKMPAKVPMLMLGYKAPVMSTTTEHDDLYALEVLAGVLDGGGSARMTRALVRGDQLATSASASYGMHARHESLFVLSAVPVDGVSLEQMEQALKGEINKLQKQAPSKAELERVKAQVIAATVYEQDSIFYQAMQVGMLETIGLGWQRKEEYVGRIKAVTPEQVQAVAKRYFVDDVLTVATLDPIPIEQGAAKDD